MLVLLVATAGWGEWLLWLFGSVFVKGWLLFSALMFVGGLVALITEPWLATPGEPKKDKLSKEEIERLNNLSHADKKEVKEMCYRQACQDAVYSAVHGNGKAAPTHVDGKGKLLYPNEWQLTMWHKWFRGLFFPNKPTWISHILGVILVTPLTNITALSLYYQLYLNEIFHTGFISRGVHYAMMPCITWTYLLFGAYFSLDDLMPWHTGLAASWKAFLIPYVGERYVEMFALNGGVVVLASFFLWYVIWGFTTRTYGFGFFMVPQLLIMWMAANVFHDWTAYKTGKVTWYNHSPLWANWIILGAIFAFIQALSHLPEPLPPRVTRTAHWASLSSFIQTHKGNPLFLAWALLGQTLWGTIDEFWAGPRLLPLLMLKQMYMLGYKPKQWEEVQYLSKMARKYGDASLDYIGTGGANQVEPLPVDPGDAPATYAEAKREHRSVEAELASGFTDIPDKKKDPGGYAKYMELLSRKNFLTGLRLRTKINGHAFGPFVADSKDRNRWQSQLANAPRNPGFRFFLDMVREDMFKLEATRQKELFAHKQKEEAEAKKRM